MAFPATPLDVAVELYVGSGWVDITSDVYLRDKIRISRGRPNESGATPPQTCALTLNNRSRNYSLRNPTGAYYGSLGRNVPLRVAIRTERDTLTRTVASGWGTSDTGGAWFTVGAGGAVAASDFNVAGGVGKHSVPVTNAYRGTYLAGRLHHDVDVAATVSGLPSDVTGAAIEPLCLLLGGLSITDHFLAPIAISAAEVVTIAITHFDGTVLVAPTTVPITYAGQPLRARFQREGHTLRAKVWSAAGSEPYAWNVELVAGATLSPRLHNRAPGWVGIRSGVAAGNTNAKPIVFSYDDVEVRSNRFAGEVSSWPSTWDVSGNDVYAKIQANGITRRLGQGNNPTPSAFFRAFTSLAVPPLVYWPAEDGKSAVDLSSGIGGAPLPISWFSPNIPKLSSNSDFDASAPIPVVNNSSWGNGFVLQGAADTGIIQTTMLLSVPSDGDTDNAVLLQVRNSGTAAYWELLYSQTFAPTGGFGVRALDAYHNLAYTGSGGTDFSLKGRPVWVSLELTQNGANVDWAVVAMDATTLTADVVSGTFASATIGAFIGLSVSPFSNVKDSAIGHIMSRNYYTSLFNLESFLAAHSGETARNRIGRLSAENGIPFAYISDGVSSSALVGKQDRDSYVTLIAEAADADMGALFEGRSSATVIYRERNANYNQAAYLEMDYAAGHLSPPFDAVEDDQSLRNDVTVSRKNGGFRRLQQLAGPLSVSSPYDAQGVGRYDTGATLNLFSDGQVYDSAGWLLSLGTVDEARYPTIKVNLALFAASRPEQLRLDALAVDIGSRITIDNPKSGFDPNQISQLVQGYKEDISSLEHSLAFTCSPESPYQVIRLDSSTLGKLDSETSTVSIGINSNTSTMLVATTATSPLWTTVSGEMPIPILVGGEEMLVTNITGAATPQTFTVTRSVNGVVKSHAVGERVSLARRATLAL